MTRPTETEADSSALAGAPSPADNTEASRWLREWTLPARRHLRLTTIAGTLHGWLLIPQAWLIALVVSSLILGEPAMDSLTLPLLLLALVMTLRVISAMARDWYASQAGLIATRGLRQRLFRHLYALGPAGLRERDAGALSSAALDQSEAIGNYVGRYLPQQAIAVLVPLGLLAAVVSQDWLAALLLFFAAPLIPLFMALVGMGASGANQRQFQALARLSGQFLDRLQGLDVLKHFGQGSATLSELRAGADDYRRRTMQVLRIAFLSSAVLEFFSSVAIAMLAIYIGLGLLGYFTLGPAPELTLQTGLFILLLAPDFFAPMRELATYYHDRAGARGAAAELAPLLEQGSPMAPRGTDQLTTDHGLTLQADGLCLAYGDRKPILEAVDLSLRPGEAVLLQGASGTGKTSLLYALMGLLQARSGTIRVNGLPLARLEPGALEKRIGWLGQNPQLLPGTIRENILLGAPAAPEERLETAARQAGVTRFSEALPQGLDTPVGERGVGLSGGEAQRVALARALLRTPALLILDEPTASLDPESRDIILEALRGLHQQGTGLLIASHQPGQFSWVDRRLQLRDGRLTDA